ncbi:MAG: dihydrolipoamide acetyltransferase family protein [bacterium]
MDVVMPQMGESIAEGTIVKWLKKPGERVQKDEPLFEISTDKVDAEIPSPGDGVLAEIVVAEGNTVAVNTVVARIQSAAGAGAPAPARPAAAPATPPPVPAAKVAPEPRPAPAPAPAPAARAPQGAPPPPPLPPRAPAPAAAPKAAPAVATLEERLRVRSSPLVRKMAAEHGVDISLVAGTGIHGRVTKVDMESYLDRLARGEAPEGLAVGPPPASVPARAAAPAAPAPAPAPPAAPSAPAARPQGTAPLADRVEPMSIMRLKIAEHMIESRRTSAHVQTFWEVDVSHLAKLRDRFGDEFQRRNGVKLSFTAFFAKATCDALKAVPVVNASIAGSEIHYHGAVNLGIAVALEWGLIVPVVKGAGDMNLGGLAKSIADVSSRARSKRLSPDEVTGGTFTITNPGIFGGLFGCPIINQPQSAILGIGAIEKRPVVIDDAIAIREMAYLSLSFDHRLIDGAVAEQFMGELKRSLTAMSEASL